jgi:hypothetical protein
MRFGAISRPLPDPLAEQVATCNLATPVRTFAIVSRQEASPDGVGVLGRGGFGPTDEGAAATVVVI